MTEPDLDLLRVIAINAYQVYRASVSGASPYLHELFQFLTHPVPGDLVLETSTVHRWLRTPTQQGLGILLRVTDEPWPRHEDDEDEAWLRSPQLECVWYVQPLDGSVAEVRWTNASFIRVLTDFPPFT